MIVWNGSRRIAGAALLLACTLWQGAALASAEGEGVRADRIEIVGSTVMSGQDRTNVTTPYLGRLLHTEDLLQLADDITGWYVARGYISSGALVPKQYRNDGRIEVEVVEGARPALQLKGLGRLHTEFISKPMQSWLHEPFNIGELQNLFAVLDQDGRIASLKGQVEPGEGHGTSTLNLVVEEADAFTVRIGASNHVTPAIGEIESRLELNHINLTGHGDEMTVAYSHTEGLDGGKIRYLWPLKPLESSIEAYYTKSDARVVEEPFEILRIASETDTAGIRYRHAVHLDAGRSTRLAIAIEKKESVTKLLGQRFDFSEGSVNGVTRATVVELGAEFRARTVRHAWALDARYRRGTDWLGADLVSDIDQSFQLVLLRANYAARSRVESRHPLTVSIRANAQLTHDTLQAFERYPLGGSASVRGYRENQFLKDNAFEVSLSIAIPLLANTTGERSLTLVPFVDYGKGWDAEERLNVERETVLSSAGVALNWVAGGFQARLAWAERFKKKQKEGDSLQDRGIYFDVSYGH